MHAQFSLTGNVRIGEILESGERIERVRQNVMTSGALGIIIPGYLSVSNVTAAPNPPLYFVIGSGTVPVGRFMTTVPGETFRTTIVQRDQTGFSVVYHAFLTTTDNANQTVGCYGLAAGAATQVANTGTLFAVAAEAVPFNKNATSVLSLDWVIQCSGVMS